MKKLFLFTLLLFTLSLNTQAFDKEAGFETVKCVPFKAIQNKINSITVNGEFIFELKRENKKSEIRNFNGEIFILNPYENEDGLDNNLTKDNSFWGNFSIESLTANQSYIPLKYKNHLQFKNIKSFESNFNLIFGEFLIGPNLNKESEFFSYYIFKAGDHMGGTIIFTCNLI